MTRTFDSRALTLFFNFDFFFIFISISPSFLFFLSLFFVNRDKRAYVCISDTKGMTFDDDFERFVFFFFV